MPATSKKQRNLFGLALSVKRGDTPRSEVSKEVLDIVDDMSEKEISKMASLKEIKDFGKFQKYLNGQPVEIYTKYTSFFTAKADRKFVKNGFHEMIKGYAKTYGIKKPDEFAWFVISHSTVKMDDFVYYEKVNGTHTFRIKEREFRDMLPRAQRAYKNENKSMESNRISLKDLIPEAIKSVNSGKGWEVFQQDKGISGTFKLGRNTLLQVNTNGKVYIQDNGVNVYSGQVQRGGNKTRYAYEIAKEIGINTSASVDKRALENFFRAIDNYNYVRQESKAVTEDDEDPCWDDYEMIGTKKKNGKEVPNCVPTNERKEFTPKKFRERLNEEAIKGKNYRISNQGGRVFATLKVGPNAILNYDSKYPIGGASFKIGGNIKFQLDDRDWDVHSLKRIIKKRNLEDYYELTSDKEVDEFFNNLWDSISAENKLNERKARKNWWTKMDKKSLPKISSSEKRDYNSWTVQVQLPGERKGKTAIGQGTTKKAAYEDALSKFTQKQANTFKEGKLNERKHFTPKKFRKKLQEVKKENINELGISRNQYDMIDSLINLKMQRMLEKNIRELLDDGFDESDIAEYFTKYVTNVSGRY